MNNKTVAKRYAQALLHIAQENNNFDLYEKELESFLKVLNDDPKIKEIWYSATILTDDKKAVLKEFFKDKLSGIIMNFLCLLIDKNRENYLPDIVKEFKALIDITKNIIDAEVRSTVQITDKDFRDLQAKLSAMTGKNVRLKTKIDPSLIGGLVVKIGDKVIDGSVIKRLAIMKKKLKEIQFNKIGVRD